MIKLTLPCNVTVHVNWDNVQYMYPVNEQHNSYTLYGARTNIYLTGNHLRVKETCDEILQILRNK